MDISISGKKMEIGQAFKTYVTEKVKDNVCKFFDYAKETQVTMTKDGHHAITADIRTHAGRGIEICGSFRDSDPHAAFDKALEKLVNQLRRYKNRLTDHHRRATKIDSIIAAQYVLRPSDVDQPEVDTAPTVIAEMTTDVPTLSVSDAVMRLDLSDAPVMIFKNASHGGINVVYRRPDGNIGWTDPRGEAQATKVTA